MLALQSRPGGTDLAHLCALRRQAQFGSPVRFATQERQSPTKKFTLQPLVFRGRCSHLWDHGGPHEESGCLKGARYRWVWMAMARCRSPRLPRLCHHHWHAPRIKHSPVRFASQAQIRLSFQRNWVSRTISDPLTFVRPINFGESPRSWLVSA